MTQDAIREATEDDAAAIAELLEQLGYPLSAGGVVRRLRDYRKTGGLVWVARTDGKVVGFLSLHMIPYFHAEGHGGRITAMCVDRDHRRQGIGSALISAMELAAGRIGCGRIEVTSGDHRKDEAHRFYKAAGYEFSTRRFLKNLNTDVASTSDLSDITQVGRIGETV